MFSAAPAAATRRHAARHGRRAEGMVVVWVWTGGGGGRSARGGRCGRHFRGAQSSCRGAPSLVCGALGFVLRGRPSRVGSVHSEGKPSHRQMDSLSVSLSDRKNLTQPKHTSDSLSAPTRCRIAYPTRRPEPTRHAHRRQRANMGMPHSTTTAARTRTTHESAAESKICARRRDKRRIAYPR